MSIVRIKKNNNFVVMDNTVLRDTDLSWKAKGIMAYLLSLPDDWSIYISEVIKHATDGEKSFRSGFKELRDRGYVKRYPVYKDNKIDRWETVVLENPLFAQNVDVDNVQVEKLHVGKEALLSTDCTKDLSVLSTDDIYTIFDYWNDKGIIKHRKFTEKAKRHARARLKEYNLNEIKQAIDNYKTVLSDPSCYWTHKWTFQDFMKPDNVVRFMNEAEPLINFKSKDNKQMTQPTNNFNYNPNRDAF